MIALLAVMLVQSTTSPEIQCKAPESLQPGLSYEEGIHFFAGAPERETLLYLEATLRLTIPGGDVVSGGPRYGDLFNLGVGGGVEFDYLWKLSRILYLGPYVELDVDSFGGTRWTDSFGDTLKPDSMTTFRILGGVKAREELGPAGHFFVEEFLGLGAIHYPSVTGTLNSGGVVTTGEVFGSRTTVAFDLGIKVGWNITPQVGLFLSIVVEINGGPSTGNDIVIVGTTGSTSPGIMVNTGLNLGIDFRF